VPGPDRCCSDGCLVQLTHAVHAVLAGLLCYFATARRGDLLAQGLGWGLLGGLNGAGC